MTPAWTADWVWSLLLIVATLAFHAIGIVAIGVALVYSDRLIRGKWLSLVRAAVFGIATISAVGWALAVLHGIEALIWAAVYVWLGALDNSADAILYSVDSFTTRGASGLQLESKWRLMGALEAADGVLLFGISTAFLFGVCKDTWDSLRGLAAAQRQRHHVRPSGGADR